MSASPVSVSPASSVIDDHAKPNAIIAQVLKLEKELAKMKTALGVEGVKTPKKARKAKDPSAPKREPNVWIKFSSRVGLLLKTTAHKGPATIAKQFASHLKDIKPYDDWTDAEILHQFSSWTVHAKGPAAAAVAPEAEAEEADASDDGFASAQSETEAPAPAPAPAPAAPEPEPKKKQTKAAKAAAAINTAIPPMVVYVPPPVTKAPPSTAETLLTNALLAAAPAAFKPKAVKSKAAAPTYTAEQLSNFTEFEHNGQTYGRNERGDLVDTESNFVGRWNGKEIETIPEPADWNLCVL